MTRIPQLRDDNSYLSSGRKACHLPHDNYDFNLEPGDTSWIKNMWCGDTEVQVIIIDIDTVEYFDIERKRWTIDYPSNGFSEYWIDGIGSTFGLLYSKYYECIVCPTWDLLCYHENDTLLYIMPGQNSCYIYSVGIDEKALADGINIYPNPARDKFEVRSGEFGVELIEVFDLTGKKLIEKHIPARPAGGPAGNNNIVVDVSALKAGTYLCRIKTENNTYSKKLILR